MELNTFSQLSLILSLSVTKILYWTFCEDMVNVLLIWKLMTAKSQTSFFSLQKEFEYFCHTHKYSFLMKLRMNKKSFNPEDKTINFIWFLRISKHNDCPVGWGSRIHRLPPPNECPDYDTWQSDSEVPVMLELWGMWSTTSLPLFPGPLWPGMSSTW